MPSGDYSPDVRFDTQTHGPQSRLERRLWKNNNPGYRLTLTWVVPASSGRVPYLLPPTFATHIDEMPHLDRLRFKATVSCMRLRVRRLHQHEHRRGWDARERTHSRVQGERRGDPR